MEAFVWRILHGLVRWLSPKVVLQVVIILVITQVTSFAIGDILRDIEGLQLFLFGAAAVLATWILHRLHTPDWLAALLLPILGGGGALATIGRLGNPLVETLRAVGQVRVYDIEDIGWQVAWGTLPGAADQFIQAAQGLFSRLGSWWSVLFRLTPAFDPLASSLTWSLFAWIIVAWLGWMVLRQDQPLLGLLPVAALLSWALYFTHSAVYPLLGVCALGSLLQILSIYFRHTDRWRLRRLELPDNLIEFSATTLLVIGSLVLTAWLASSFSLRQVEKYLRELITPPGTASSVLPGDVIGKAFGLEIQPEPVSLFKRALQPTLPSQHLLRGGPELSENVVMWIALDGFQAVPIAAAEAAPRPPQYYWRSLTYNRYNGRGWYTDPAEIVGYAAGTQLVDEPLEQTVDNGLQYRFIRQNVRVFRQGGGELYHTGELLAADQDFQVAWRSQAAPGDALGALVGSDQYTALSRRLLANPQVLRQAGSVYPDWVLARYLVIPDSLPNRVRELALDLTATQPTPYDRAVAIETYLRRSYTYTVDLPDPPTGVDVVDYFLFEIDSGYCDYYASAMTVLARSAGLPARLVTGYAGGTWVPEQGHMVVTQADAHSWVEIYFPGYGWIEFEPTSSRDLFERSTPEEITQAANQPVDLTLPPRPGWRETLQARLAFLKQAWPQALIAAWLLITLVFKMDEWRLRLFKPQATIEKIFRRLYRQAERLGVRSLPGGTLREFTLRLTGLLEKIAGGGPWQAELRQQANDVRWLSDLYEQALFSHNPPGRAEQKRCIAAWKRMRIRWWIARLRARV